MCFIQDRRVSSFITIIEDFGISILGILRVSWMKEWFTPYDLGLVNLDKNICSNVLLSWDVR